jgi:hypothetical protein
LQSGIVDIPFTWSRYRLLKKHDFIDDLSVVAPEDLMGGGGGQPIGGMPQMMPEMQ